MTQMIIRPAKVEDAEKVTELHGHSIRGLCGAVYSPEQVAVWADHRTLADYQSRIQQDPCYVAEIGGTIVGFARFRPQSGEFCSLFVHPHYARQGVGRALMNQVFTHASRLGMAQLWLDASLNAVPFYQLIGFVSKEEMTHTFSGVKLECVRMERLLESQ